MEFLNYNIFFHLLWLLPFLFLLFIFSWRWKQRILFLLIENSSAYNTLSKGKRFLREFLLIFALFLLLVAAARPTWGKRIISITNYGRDVILVVDVSKSMLATDISPSRLEHAKWFIRELIGKCPEDRFAIVPFAGKAFLQCPLTSDKTSLIQMINELGPEQIPLGGTNIQEALNTALKSFEAAEGAHRAIVLISDGEELYGSVDSILNELKEKKIPIFSVGLGNPNQKTPIAIRDAKGGTNFLRDSKGEIVSTRLNEELLKKIALSSGGVYIRSTSTDTGLEVIVKAISDLSSEKFSSKESYRPIERFQLPLLAAIILLLCRLSIGERKKIVTSLVFAFFICVNVFTEEQTQIPATDNSVIEKAIKDPEKTPLAPYELYNLALDKQKSEKIEEAEKLYLNAISSINADTETILRASQNLGVIDHQKGRKLLKSNPQSALEYFYGAQKFYNEAMCGKSSEFQIENIANNQQILLNDIETAKKLIEEQKQQQKSSEEAREEVKKALDENQKSKNSPQNKEQKSKAINQNQKAQNALDKVKNQTADEGNQMKEQIQKAIEEMKKAESQQQKENFSKAEEHIKNAMKEFSKADEKKQDSEKQSQEEVKDNLSPEQNTEKQERKMENDEENQNKNLDPQMAETILDLINKDENKLREELQKREIEKFRIKEVEKDW